MSLDEKIKELLDEWDEAGLKELCTSAMNNKEASPVELIKIIGTVMKNVGKEFEEEEIFLPDLIGASEIVKKLIDEVLEPAIEASGEKREDRIKVVIGTVESDVHSIGKDLVGSFLYSNGFEVFNLGEEVPAKAFIDKAEEVGAKVIGLSSLLTMSMDFQRQVIEELNKRGLRDKYKVIVGGSPTSSSWSKKIGADGWADDAVETVALVRKILSIND